MAVILNKRAYTFAKQLVENGEYVYDEKDDWSEHEPTPEVENIFIEAEGFGEYGKWFLGVDDEENEDVKKRYKFPYGDFKKVHRCGVLAAENRAGQYKYDDIEKAAHSLHELIDSSGRK